jgi:hypothetical protein
VQIEIDSVSPVRCRQALATKHSGMVPTLVRSYHVP